jgi:hypothetical protein
MGYRKSQALQLYGSPAIAMLRQAKFRPSIRIFEEGAKNGGVLGGNHGIVHRPLACYNDSYLRKWYLKISRRRKIHENELGTLGI